MHLEQKLAVIGVHQLHVQSRPPDSVSSAQAIGQATCFLSVLYESPWVGMSCRRRREGLLASVLFSGSGEHPSLPGTPRRAAMWCLVGQCLIPTSPPQTEAWHALMCQDLCSLFTKTTWAQLPSAWPKKARKVTAVWGQAPRSW